jgi:hypothetical protein
MFAGVCGPDLRHYTLHFFMLGLEGQGEGGKDKAGLERGKSWELILVIQWALKVYSVAAEK